MVWAAVTATVRSPLVFVSSGVKLNSQRYISDILEGELLHWAREHIEGAAWFFQQDSAPSHGSRITQQWMQSHMQSHKAPKEPRPECGMQSHKEDWPSRSPDLDSFVLFGVVHPREQGLPIFS